jgi:hypothetical protein
MSIKILVQAGVRSVLAIVVVLVCAAKVLAAPDYNIPDLPSQTCWQGTTNQFLVRSDRLGTGALLSIQVPSPPVGALALDPGTRSFRYTPDPADKLPFSVTFVATLGSDTESREVTFNPVPRLPPEGVVFGLTPDQSRFPDPEDKSFIARHDAPGKTLESFNNRDQYPRSVTVSGRRLVFEQGHPNGLYDYDGNDSIKNLTLYADSVVIRSPLRLPQTNVTIYARELRFEDKAGTTDKAYLSTTPNRITTLPAQFANGLDGLPAGSITLHLQSLYAEGTAKRLVVKGGDGQPAGLGKNGDPGADAPHYTSCGSFNVMAPYTNNAVFILFAWSNFGPFIDPCGDPNRWPGNGLPGISPGRPGNGGKGGTVTATLQDASGVAMVGSYLVDSSGGVCGVRAPDAPGGAGGNPRPAVHVVAQNQGFGFGDYWVQWIDGGEHYSQTGATTVAPSALLPIGPDGTVQAGASAYDWLHPVGLKLSLGYLKKLYLLGFVGEAKDLLSGLQTNLDGLLASASWAQLAADQQADYRQIYGEVQILLHRIAANQDYFGNPAGWVPMLSFEANLVAYQNEIEPALRTWYLTYWLNNKAATLQQRKDSLVSARAKLQDEINSTKTQLNTSVQAIPALQMQIIAIDREAQLVKQQLDELDGHLQDRARSIVAERHRAQFWKSLLGICGSLVSVLPVGQPVLGAIGKGLTAVSTIDPQQPLSVTYNLPQYNGGLFTADQDGWNEISAKVQSLPATLASGDVAAYSQQVAAALAPVEGRLKDNSALLELTQVPDDEVEQELLRLRASDPAFTALTGNIRNLIRDKKDFAGKLEATAQAIGVLSKAVEGDLSAIQGFDTSITSADAALDDRLLTYLNEMERSSKDRLLKYHYYVKKAYEYRLLKPYPGDLDLDTILNKMIDLANAKIASANGAFNVAGGQELSAQEFAALKPLYENQIATVAAAIYDEYNSSPPTRTAPLRFALAPADIGELNAGHTVTLNLMKLGRFSPAEENIRIVDLRVYSLAVHPVGGSYHDWADLDLEMKHSGYSKLASKGQVYQFGHYNNSTSNPLTWGVRYDAKYAVMSPIVPSAAASSLLKTLLASQARPVTDMILYSLPAGWADIYLTKSVNTDNGIDIAVDSVVLELTYDFTSKPVNLATLQVKSADANLAPLFVPSAADLNGRKEGAGDVYRTYPKGTGLTVTAPARYGALEFVNWTNRVGAVLGTGTTLSVTLSGDQSVLANYRNTYQEPLLVTVGGSGTGAVTSDRGTLNWEGATGSASYLYGSSVTLSPIPSADAVFSGWSGACTGTGSCTLIMDDYREVGATFTRRGACGSSSGAVLSSAPTANLCSFGAPSASGAWNWNCVGGTSAACSATLGYPLSVTVAGAGGGTVVSHSNSASVIGYPADIACTSGTCSAAYPSGNQVHVAGVPDSKSMLAGVAGACSALPCDLTMGAAKTLTVTFTPAPSAKNSTTGTLYWSLGDALTGAAPGDEIRLLDTSFTGAVTLNKSLIIRGGWYTDFSAKSGLYSTCANGVTVTGGAVTLDTVQIKGKVVLKGGRLSSQKVRIAP